MSDECPKCGADLADLRRQLAEAARWEVGRCAQIRDALAFIAVARAELARLRDVVDKLPKTADGVPVVPGMTLWCPSMEHGPRSQTTIIEPEFRCELLSRYSTREAAEAAKETT